MLRRVKFRLSYLALAALSSAALLGADVAGVVGRSDLILERPNLKAEEAMPLGNGRLGVAIWSEDGMTIQLNRADTLPRRLSPGQIVVPGLARLIHAPDYQARVDLYNGELRESGGSMQATVWVDSELDAVVIDVKGAGDAPQSVRLRLWPPRQPRGEANPSFALLSETWKDDTALGSSGERFGSLAAVAVKGRNVRAVPRDPHEPQLSFLPEADGSFRIWIAAPTWKGGDARSATQLLLDKIRAAPDTAHRLWWNQFWQHSALMKLESADHSAEYFENLRALDLFLAAAESGDRFPGSQAGVGDLFSSARDFHQWDPAAYWHWNLRMQVAANLGAGVPQLNAPYFRLYRDNLANIERWTREYMANRPGICVPETMRFNGVGIEAEQWTKPAHDCDATWPPYYNARTLSTGAEVSLWIWRQYLLTDDRAFLAQNYPVIAAAARFLLAYAKTGSDGKLHTAPSNAHENQWDVRDPITDICAMRTLFPAVIEASKILHRDADLADRARQALAHVVDLPLEGAPGEQVLAQSYDPGAPVHNSENLGLEPVWPYQLIGPRDPLAIRTWQRRPNKFQNDWSYDPLDAAHIGLSNEMKTALLRLTEKYQAYPSGLAHFVGPEFYREQLGVVAAALQDALAFQTSDALYLAQSWPKDWNAEATMAVNHASRVYLRIRDGRPEAIIFRAGYSGILPYQIGAGPIQNISVTRGEIYDLLNRHTVRSIPTFEGRPADHPKQLGTRTLGLFR